jgi:hypothetical protein
MEYKLLNFGNGTLNTSVVYCVTTGYTIPTTDPNNTDYQAYLKWISEGHTPLPAESN